ncbi:MAG: lysophospholipid acyltransferase family protein [Gemmatimonadales bacterium]
MIRTLAFGVLVLVSTIFFSVFAIVAGLLKADKGAYDWVHRNWSRAVLWAAGVKVEVVGLEHVQPGGAQIFVSNHQSMFDIWAMFATLPVSLRFIAKKELSRIPVFAHAMRHAGHVFIDRKDRSQAAEAMRRAGERMQDEGLSLGLFPEGTRSRDGALGAFKKGAFALAIETRTTLVPIVVDGGAEIMPDGFRLRPRPLLMHCGAPIDLSGLDAGDRDDLLARSRAEISGMLEEARRLRPLRARSSSSA